MPSLLAKLGLRRSQPKVFVKAMDTVAKTLKPSSRRNKKNKGKNAELVVAAAPLAVPEAPGVDEFPEDGVDLTNSVMLLNKLSILQEDSIQEKEEQTSVLAVPTQAISQPVGGDREESMDTFIEHMGDAEDESLIQEDDVSEEKTNFSNCSSPITVIPQPAEEVDVEEEAAPVVVVAVDREESNAKPEEISTQSEVVAVVKPVQTISETVVVEPATVVVAEEKPKKEEVFTTNSKPAVLESIRRATFAARPVSNNVGSLRARFETNATTSKPLTPASTSLKSVLAARNNAKFAERKLEAAKVAVVAEPVAIEEVKSVPVEEATPVAQEEVAAVVAEEAKVIETVIEAAVAAVEESKPVEEFKAVEEEVSPVIQESAPIVEEVKTEVDHSAAVAAIARAGDEKALFASMLEIAAKPYKEQAVWFLNAYWNEIFKNDQQACERVWRFAFKFAELDQSGAKGFELDEIRAHRVLEVLAEAMTITEMRTKFHRRAKHVSLIELLIFIFSADWTQVVLAPQGSVQALEQMQQAEALMAKSSAAVEESKQKASQSAADERRAEETAKQALESKNKAVAGETLATEAESRAIECEQAASSRAEEAAAAFSLASKAAEEAAQAEAETVKRAEESARAEEEARQVQEQAVKAEKRAVEDENRAREAESEAFRREVEAKDSEQRAVEAERILIDDQARVEAALNKVKEEEAAFTKLLQDLKATSENESIGIVARRKAAHEREMLLAKDPDPLTRARIAEEAVVRKHEKQIRLAAQARAAATDARSGAEKSRDRAVSARIGSEGARSEAAIRRSASETKAAAAVEARQLSDAARESATAAREESEARRKASDEALESARHAKEEASAARQVAAAERALATVSKVQAEGHEREALAAKALASKSRENAESAVVEAVNAFERASHFVERVRKQASSGQGGWWWASREIEESKRYVPQRMLKKLTEQQMF